MADKIIPNLPKSEAPTFDDLMLVVDTPASTPTNKKVTLKNLFNKVPTTIGYGTETVSSVDVSDTTQALDDKALFICTAIGTQDRIATMSDGNHVGQTTTIVLVASSGTTTTYVQLEDGAGPGSLSCVKNGTTTVTTASTEGLVAGMVVTGTGIPGSTTIASITNSTTFVLSAAATDSLTSTLSFTSADTGRRAIQMEWGYSQIPSSVDMIIMEHQVGFKITPNNFLDHTGGPNTKVSLPNIGDSATLMWTGSKWIVTSFVGSATTSP